MAAARSLAHRAGPAVEAFAVDDSSVQLVWRDGPPGPVTVELSGSGTAVAASSTEVVGAGGPGSVVLGGLAAGRPAVARVTFPGARPIDVAFTTLPGLPGPVRARIATVSDLHLGLRAFGLRYRIKDHQAGDSAGIRCSRAALAEAEAWGPDLIIVKGDVTNTGRRIEWRQAADLLAEVSVPVVVLPGNHELADRRTIEPWHAAEEFGLHVVSGVESIDLPGIRVVLVPTAIPGRSRGRLADIDPVVAAAADAPAALVVLHHQLEHRPDPFFWPPGIPRDQADRFLAALAEAQPAALVTSGHTHRHQRRQVGPLTVTQVGSTKDYPGVWAGYAVHDAGIAQLVRRVAEPDCLVWTDRTRRALGGYWGRTSAGSIDDRCFRLTWPTDRPEHDR